MIRKFLLLVLVIFLAACSFIPQPTPFPTLTVITRTPSATPSAIPLATLTATLPAASPTSTKDPSFFRDDFAGALDANWHWIREDPANWSLTEAPGSLQINVGGGYVNAQTNRNLLLRPAPTGDFQIETQVTFQPQDNFQFAGLIIYESDANFIQSGRGYCRTYECVGEGLYMNYYQNKHAVQPDFGQSYKEINPILLRLSRRADSYTFEASTDGKIWFIIGSHTSDMKPLQIGLVTGQNVKGKPHPAVFDYFEVRSLP
jgi:beta-xylosidase